MTKFESYDLHSWTEKHHGPAHTVWGTLYKSDLPLLASSEDELKGALAVLDGKSSGIDDEGAVEGRHQAGHDPADAGHRTGQGRPHVNCELAKYVEAVAFSLGEDGGESFFTAKVVARTPTSPRN